MLLTASLDGTVCCWELSSGKVRQQIQTHAESVMDCDWFDEQYFASCSQDKSVHRAFASLLLSSWHDSIGTVCSIHRANPIHRFRGHKDEVNACRFDPTKTVLATCSDDKTVRLWSMLDILPTGPKKEDSTPMTEVIRNGGSFVLEGHTNDVQTIMWHPHAGLKEGQPRLLAS
jgi:WD40 repeat protein